VIRSKLFLGFLLQEVQLEGEDLERGVHLVDNAQAAAAYAGVAIVACQLFKAPLQDGAVLWGIRRRSGYRDGVPRPRRGLRPGGRPGQALRDLGFPV
jgi:hypothetical protein